MPSLPVELWWDILRLAARTPGQFETKWDHSPDVMIWEGWGALDSLEESYFDSLPTKSSICQVSKSWRDIGVELLYEHLFFFEWADEYTNKSCFTFRMLPKLISIFEQHADHPSGYGRSTKRVDISIIARSRPVFPLVLRLLELCHNIRIIDFSCRMQPDDAKEQSELSSLLQSRFSHSLRRMNFRYQSGRLVYLPNVPLDALKPFLELPSTIDPPSAIATVSTLCLNFNYAPVSWHFPALRHLSVVGCEDDRLPFLQPFMAVHGPQILSLHVDVYLDFYTQNLLTILPNILAQTTNLRCLSIPPAKIKWPPPGNSFPSITHIGLQSDSFPRAFDIEPLISGSLFPGLQCLRFLSHSNPVGAHMDPEAKSSFLALLEVGLKLNVRFEDNKCRLIQIIMI